MPWWHSQNEERWHGPEDTREGAIQAGTTDYDGDPFFVCEAEQTDCDLSLPSWVITERLTEDNEELLDPDGDGLFAHLTNEQRRDLEASVAAAIKAWADRHNLSYLGWHFTKQGLPETITPVKTPAES